MLVKELIAILKDKSKVAKPCRPSDVRYTPPSNSDYCVGGWIIRAFGFGGGGFPTSGILDLMLECLDCPSPYLEAKEVIKHNDDGNFDLAWEHLWKVLDTADGEKEVPWIPKIPI